MTGEVLIDILIYAGSALMIWNIVRYLQFQKFALAHGKWEDSGLLLRIPLILLILFLAGYLAVGFFGRPDLIIAGILFGGSVFVFVILKIMRSIAQHIRDHEELHYKLMEAQRASEAKTFFLSNMSHDIRTPLNAVIGYTSLAKQEGASPDQMRGYIDKIESSSNYLLELINDILEMSRIESGKLELTAKAEDLGEIMAESEDLFRNQMEEKSIRFETEMDVTDRFVVCDRKAVNRILLNLISNAWKFTPEGGSVTVELKQIPGAGVQPADGHGTQPADQHGRAVYQLQVRDTGIGMTKEFSEKIFEAFERERTATDSGIHGTGLGMAITKNLVERMDGEISVDTAPGKGTTFIVKLPFEPATAPEAADGPLCKCGDAAAAKDLTGMRILLVEDIEINREIAGRLLEAMGIIYDTADNGLEALRKVEAGEGAPYDAILMDIQMPVMGGYEAAEQIRALEDPGKASIPIIALTANAFAEDIRAAEDAGMSDHVAKPVDPRDLQRALCRFR